MLERFIKDFCSEMSEIFHRSWISGWKTTRLTASAKFLSTKNHPPFAESHQSMTGGSLEIEYLQKGNKFFLTNPRLNAIAKSLKDVVSVGVLLGETKNSVFFPSLYLLNWLSKRTHEKVIVTDKAAWLFLCRRDILKESIVSQNAFNQKVDKGMVLVQNKLDENLGYGKITPEGIKCILDRGDYLRRERKSSRA